MFYIVKHVNKVI